MYTLLKKCFNNSDAIINTSPVRRTLLIIILVQFPRFWKVNDRFTTDMCRQLVVNVLLQITIRLRNEKLPFIGVNILMSSNNFEVGIYCILDPTKTLKLSHLYF